MLILGRELLNKVLPALFLILKCEATTFTAHVKPITGNVHMSSTRDIIISYTVSSTRDMIILYTMSSTHDMIILHTMLSR